MIDQLSQMQARILTMRDALLKEDSVIPSKTERITIPEVKITVLWYLDCHAAAVAGALWHMKTVKHDDFLSVTDKAWMQTRIATDWLGTLDWFSCVVKDFDYQDLHNLELDFMEAQAETANEWRPPLDERKREEVVRQRTIVSETYSQLSMVKREVAEKFQTLGANVT